MFEELTAEFGALSSKQLDGIATILSACPPDMPARQVAYVLATAWHETDRKMQPIEEYGRGAGHTYGKVDPVTGYAYYGRGFVQLTWADNYKTLSSIVGVDLYHHPELALRPDISARILVEGMRRGLFTGKKLNDYIGTNCDYYNARRIINGLDKAEKIAGYAKSFERCLTPTVAPAPQRLPTLECDLPTLRQNSKSLSVYLLQAWLGARRDGIFGLRTKNAVGEFQKKAGLGADGVVGPNTWGALLSDKLSTTNV